MIKLMKKADVSINFIVQYNFSTYDLMIFKQTDQISE